MVIKMTENLNGNATENYNIPERERRAITDKTDPHESGKSHKRL